MVTIFWNASGILLVSGILSTVGGLHWARPHNQRRLLCIASRVLGELRTAIIQKRWGTLRNGVRLLQDNASTHKNRVGLNKSNNCCLTHPAPRTLHRQTIISSLTWIKQLRGRKFEDDEETKAAVPVPVDLYKEGLEALQKRSEKCIAVDGDYEEKWSGIIQSKISHLHGWAIQRPLPRSNIRWYTNI